MQLFSNAHDPWGLWSHFNEPDYFSDLTRECIIYLFILHLMMKHFCCVLWNHKLLAKTFLFPSCQINLISMCLILVYITCVFLDASDFKIKTLKVWKDLKGHIGSAGLVKSIKLIIQWVFYRGLNLVKMLPPVQIQFIVKSMSPWSSENRRLVAHRELHHLGCFPMLFSWLFHTVCLLHRIHPFFSYYSLAPSASLCFTYFPMSYTTMWICTLITLYKSASK